MCQIQIACMEKFAELDYHIWEKASVLLPGLYSAVTNIWTSLIYVPITLLRSMESFDIDPNMPLRIRNQTRKWKKKYNRYNILYLGYTLLDIEERGGTVGRV